MGNNIIIIFGLCGVWNNEGDVSGTGKTSPNNFNLIDVILCFFSITYNPFINLGQEKTKTARFTAARTTSQA